MAEKDEGLSVIGISLPQQVEYRGLRELLGAGGATGTFKLEARNLTEGLNQFIAELDAALKGIKTTMHGFELEELEVSATLTSEGRLVLVALEGELGISGGLKFTFARRDSSQAR
jgi:hypothetical protein